MQGGARTTARRPPAFPEGNAGGLSTLAFLRAALWLGILLAFVFLFFFRRVNLDEGWYLWASKLVFEGKVLYRDFAYTQAPVLPFVYGLFGKIAGLSLYSGRILTLFFALGSALLAGRIANRHGGLKAELLTLVFVAGSVYAAANLSYTATYAPASFLMLLSLYLAGARMRPSLRAALAGACIALAVGVRLSLVAAVPGLLLYIAWMQPSRRRGLAAATLALVAALAVIFGPFLLLAPDNMRYDMLGFHTDRTKPEWQVAAILGAVSDTLRDFSGLLLASVAAVVLAWYGEGRRKWVDFVPLAALLLAAFALFAIHLIPRTTNSAYNTLQAPLLSIVIGSGAARLKRPWLLALFVVLGLVNAVQQWQAVRRYDMVPAPLYNQVEVVREAAGFLRANAAAGAELVTFSPHLALESGLPLAEGFEMSIFSYRPTWSTEEARARRVINNDLLIEALDRGGAAAFHLYDFELLYGERERVLSKLQQDFRLSKTVPRFDPYGNPLRIYLRPRNSAPPPEIPRTAQLGGGITLLGHDGLGGSVAPGSALRFALYWQAAATPDANYTVFTHLLSPDGTVVGGWDNPPCRGTCPTTSWMPGEIIRDEYEIAAPQGLAAGVYTVEAGLYDPATRVRLPVLGAGDDEQDRIILGQVRVE